MCDRLLYEKKRYEITNNQEKKDPCEHLLLSLVEQQSFQKGIEYADQSSISTHTHHSTTLTITKSTF